MKHTDFIKLIEKTAPLSLAAEWDNSGVQIAAPDYDITHAAVMLDPTLTGVRAALECGADFILAHHPLTLKPRFLNNVDSYREILTLLFSSGFCLYSAHTSLDANPAGPVAWLGRELSLRNMHVLEPVSSSGWSEAGFGFVGQLPVAVSYSDFCHLLSELTGKIVWRSCGPEPITVSIVACCPGSGADMINLAASCGADVYITGDIKYHAALDADIRILDIGHFQLEEIMMRKFALQLAEEAAPIKISFISGEDPFVFERVSNTSAE